MAASEAWVHSGWMSKQGHLNPAWKNRFFVLTSTELAYYKEEVNEPAAATPAGVVPLQDALIYPTIWAPQGMFGWMLCTGGGVKYLFRTFGFKDREAWLRKINALPCVRVPSSHEQEKIHKQETRTSMLGGLFRRSSFALTDNSQHSAAVKSPLIDADTLDKREVRYFLKECGLAKHYNDFVGKGVTSFQKLVDFVADSGADTEYLTAAPFCFTSRDIANLRRALSDVQSGSAVSLEVTLFLARCQLPQFLEKFEAFGACDLETLLNPDILSDDDLQKEIGLNAEQLATFRAAMAKELASNGSQKKVANRGVRDGNVNAGEDEYTDDELMDSLENENEDGRTTIDEFLAMKNDIIDSAHVALGMPYIGRHGKRHPIFDVVLVGQRRTKRVRSYRFRTLRLFQTDHIEVERNWLAPDDIPTKSGNISEQMPIFYSRRLTAIFPVTLAKSTFGLQLSEAELDSRTLQLGRWVHELLALRAAMAPRLRRAMLQLFQVDEQQLFPETLTLGRLVDNQNVSAGLSASDTTGQSSTESPGVHVDGPSAAPAVHIDKLEVAITKGVEGLGLDLIPMNDIDGTTTVQISIVTPYSKDVSIPHPAVAATPPLMNKDEVIAVNGVSHGGDFDRCREFIMKAGTNLTLTVLRRRSGPLEYLGAFLGSWHVTMGGDQGGDGALFVSAHKIETEGYGSRRFGLLLTLQRVVENVRYAVFVPADDLTKVCVEHFGASLLVPSKALELAKLFANLLELREIPAGSPLIPGVPPALARSHYVLRAPDSGVDFGWAAACMDTDSLQVCFQRAAHTRETHLSAKATTAQASSASDVANSVPTKTDNPAESVATTAIAAATICKYTLSVDDLGVVEGVPPEAIKLLPSGDAVGMDGLPGQRVQVDFQGRQTNATIVSIEAIGHATAASSQLTGEEGSTTKESLLSEDSDVENEGEQEAGKEESAAAAADEIPEAMEVDSGWQGVSAEEHILTDEMLADEVKGVMSHEEFKDGLLRGIQVIKFNRRGQAAFRTLTLIGDHSLTWMTPKDAIAAGFGGESGINPSAKIAIGQKRDVFAKALGFDNLFDLRELIEVRAGEAEDEDATEAEKRNAGEHGVLGTPTLRKYSSRKADGLKMQLTGHCLSLIFPNRTVDIGTDSNTHRDFMMQGFRLLTERGVGGGRLINMVIKYRAPKMVPARRGSTAAEKAEATAASDPGGLGIVSLHSHAKSHGKVMELVVVGEVRPGGEAELAGLKTGDRLYQIQGRPQEQWVASKGGSKMSLADLVTIKLNHIAKNRNARNVHLTVERLHDVLDKHEEQAAGDALKLKVVRERQLMAFLNENGLSRYAVAVLRLGVGSIEELKCVSKKDLLAKSKFGMNKADAKRLTAAFTTMETVIRNDDSEANNSGAASAAVSGIGNRAAAAISSETISAMEQLRAVLLGSSHEPEGNLTSWRSGNGIETWEGVVLGGGDSQQVVELDLSHCGLEVANGGLSALRPPLRLLSDLRVLTLSGNEKLSGNLSALVDILPNLETLYLDDCQCIVGDLKSLHGMKKLKTLSIDNCKQVIGSKATLKNEVAALQILSAHGTNLTG